MSKMTLSSKKDGAKALSGKDDTIFNARSIVATSTKTTMEIKDSADEDEATEGGINASVKDNMNLKKR